ncbi:MAG: DUF6134 family protein [Acidiferrobacteraceae bacterium]|jgi:hypothetical protein
MNRVSIRTRVMRGALVLTAVLAQSAFAGPTREWRFNVYLDDTRIGQHDFRLSEQEDGRRRIDIDARFDVKLLFFTAYRYRHSNTELWQQRCLRSIRASTDDNGDRLLVQGSAEDGLFRLERGADQGPLSRCVMSFAYWDPAILKADRLLNSQTGEYVDINVVPLGNDLITVAGEAVPASRYRLLAGEAVIDLWYGTDSGRWLALQSTTTSGRTLSYRME